MQPPRYHVCPRCGRAVPAASRQRFCLNDGTPLLVGCAGCGSAIDSPHARHCGHCGQAYHRDRAEPAGFPHVQADPPRDR